MTRRWRHALPPSLALAAALTAACSDNGPTPDDDLVGATYRLTHANDTAVPSFIFRVLEFGVQELDSAHLRFTSRNRAIDVRHYSGFILPADTQVLGYTRDGNRIVLQRAAQPSRPARSDTGTLTAAGLVLSVDQLGFTQRPYRFLYERR